MAWRSVFAWAACVPELASSLISNLDVLGLIGDLDLHRLRDSAIDKALLAATVIARITICMTSPGRTWRSDGRCVVRSVVSEVLQLDVTSRPQTGIVRRTMLATFAEEVADQRDRWDGTDDDTDGRFNHGPVHRYTHCPVGIWVCEERGKETKTDAGGDDRTITRSVSWTDYEK